jgi:hypothetical protein
LNFDSNTARSTARRPKVKKSLKKSSRRWKGHKTNKLHEKWQTKERAKKSSKSNSPILSMQALLLKIDMYHVSSLNHPISKSSTKFVHILSPFGNELIKHRLREEDTMHEIKIRVLHKI